MKNPMRWLFLYLIFFSLVQSAFSADDLKNSTTRAIQMAETIFKETGLKKGEKASQYNDWMYQNHMIGVGLRELGVVLERPKFKNYYKENLIYFCDAVDSGAKWRHLKHYKKPTTMWHCGLIAGVVEQYRENPNSVLLEGMKKFEAMLSRVPALEDGVLLRYKGAWKSNALQIDDVYMVVPYWARKAQIPGNASYLEKAIHETLVYHELLWDSESELMHCLWLEKGRKHAAHHWGRGNGWFVMAITDLLNFVPPEHPKYESVVQAYRSTMKGLVRRQNENGLWHQVLDRPESFTETSCSAMFTYSLLMGSRLGWLDADFRSAGIKGWKGLQSKLTESNQLKDTCPPTDMSDDVNYFLDRPRKTHDQHAIGPFLLAASEILKIEM